MIRERALKIVLVVLGILFAAAVYPMVALRNEAVQMMMSVYATLGVFLLLASRNPSAHRSLIAFAAWSSFAHAAVMTVQSMHNVDDRAHLLGGSAFFVIVGAVLIALAPEPAVNARLTPESR